jgi:hypothetical protein
VKSYALPSARERIRRTVIAGLDPAIQPFGEED